MTSMRHRALAAWRRLVPAPHYGSWEAAKRAAGSYDDALITRFRIARSDGALADGALLRRNILSVVIPAVGRDDVSIVDFGGATGDLGREVLRAHPRANYTVVEHPGMVMAMGERDGVRFATSIPAQCDIFFSSGTLQYLDDPMAVLAQGLASARYYCVLVRNSFSRSERFSVQRSRLFENGNGPIPPKFSDRTISYPHRTLIEDNIVQFSELHGFNMISGIEESNSAIRGAYGRQIVLQRAVQI